ncbi:hypothetical protein HMPREF3229_01645 [Peptoniphilus harei]|uniref:Uncharacterized protein n=1 Tax=Peptoniphilus harei TaxID=54005 RepID=A0A133PJE5_9FIRM|nr:hypothetical protein HMPREF3229_01645 [Peptoniphilus harei]
MNFKNKNSTHISGCFALLLFIDYFIFNQLVKIFILTSLLTQLN